MPRKIVIKKNTVKLKNKQTSRKVKGGLLGSIIAAIIPLVATKLLGVTVPAEVAEFVGPEIAEQGLALTTGAFAAIGSWVGGFFTKSRPEDLEIDPEDAA